MKRGLALLGGIGLVLATSVSQAQADSTGQDVAYGTGSVLTTLVYAPVKASFCILGGITSGFTLPFAGPDTAGKVATTACGGGPGDHPHRSQRQGNARLFARPTRPQTLGRREASPPPHLPPCSSPPVTCCNPAGRRPWCGQW